IRFLETFEDQFLYRDLGQYKLEKWPNYKIRIKLFSWATLPAQLLGPRSLLPSQAKPNPSSSSADPPKPAPRICCRRCVRLGFAPPVKMLSRISRLGVHALSRARLGQKSVTSRNQEEPIRACMNYVGNRSLCSATEAKVNDRSEQPKAKISVTFVDKDGDETVINVPIGMSMLEAAHENDIELEGACEGSLACSTCHVIVTDVDYYNKLEDPEDEENDMLDLAFGLTETSRLGCQVIASPELDGIRLALPAATRNFAVDGHVPKPH
uniref:2Fe-2S ferredoxin-type domain-containing protein n=5 Tax=Triticinae TaxID=1648030 RepID=A0A453KUT5_AEGTS